MDYFLLFQSFVAGILTVLAPCVFTLLPIIIGSAVTGSSKAKPFVVIGSLIASILFFTFILKVLSNFANIDPNLLSYFSAAIVIFFGLISLFPNFWQEISYKIGFSNKSEEMLSQSKQKEGVVGWVLVGASLGPVFTSCSPTYVLIISTVLRSNAFVGLINILIYCLGLGIILLGISVLGRQFVTKLKFLANPNGIFKKVIGILFILVGISILTGFDKYLGTLNIGGTQIEQAIFFDKKEGQIISKTETKFDSSAKAGQVGSMAPEIIDTGFWINSQPLKLENLKDKVVLVDFWTYSCINCKRVQPYLNNWHSKYADKGLVIIGVHAPEFAFEKDTKNVQKAVDEAKIKYPVVLDNDYATWNKYNNQFWPAKYLISKNGVIDYTHFGEGKYQETEEQIIKLLGTNDKANTQILQTFTNNPNQTPETYLGWSRSEKGFKNSKEAGGQFGKEQNFNYQEITTNDWTISGNWTIAKEHIVAGKDAKLKLKYNSRTVNLVAGGTGELLVNDKKITVSEDKMYQIIDNQIPQENQLEIQATEGLKLNVFTFGSEI